MTDEQIVAAAKAIDTPRGPITLIHTRDDGQEVPTLMAKQFAAALTAATSELSLNSIIELADKHRCINPESGCELFDELGFARSIEAARIAQ
jgi:hypothetical protein